MQFAVNVGFAHAAGDQLGNLRAEVENKDFVLGHGGNFAKCKKTVRPGGQISNLNRNKKGRLKRRIIPLFRRPL